MSLKHVILSVLAQKPATGYDLARVFERSARHFWNASHQQIYRDLAKLADDGLVAFELVPQDSRPDRKVYRLQEAGRRELDRWTATASIPKINSEMLVKLVAAAAFGPARVRSLLQAQRLIHVERLDVYRAIEQDIAAEQQRTGGLPLVDLTAFLALRLGLRGEQQVIEWIDESLASLDRFERGAGPD